jgi:hypothetical protein
MILRSVPAVTCLMRDGRKNVTVWHETEGHKDRIKWNRNDKMITFKTPSCVHTIVMCRLVRVTKITRSRTDGLLLLASCWKVLLITLKYSAIADLHTLQFTVEHTLGFSVFTIRLLATDLKEIHTSNHYEVFLLFRLQSIWNLGTKSLLDSLLQLTTYS